MYFTFLFEIFFTVVLRRFSWLSHIKYQYITVIACICNNIFSNFAISHLVRMKQQRIHHISVLLIAIVALTSVIQFHHHDCDGNIYIHLTTFNDLSLGQFGNGIEKCNHHNHHDDGHNDCDGESDCSMHLGVYTVTRENDFNCIASLPLIDGIISETIHICEYEVKAISKNSSNSGKLLRINDLIFSSSAFRAPPYSFI